MFENAYEKLGMADKENFSRIVNQLLAHTFLTVEEHDFSEGTVRTSRDYLFTERHMEMFQEYFSYAGFRLAHDRNYGVIYLTSSYEGNRVRFDKLTTCMTYALRLMYEEEREKLVLSKEVVVTTGDLVHKLINLGVVSRKPADSSLHNSLAMLARFRIVEKMDGAWEEAGTLFLILPTILFIVSNEQISAMYKLIDEDPKKTTDEEDMQEEDLYEEA